jgi:hypothetical protein
MDGTASGVMEPGEGPSGEPSSFRWEGIDLEDIRIDVLSPSHADIPVTSPTNIPWGSINLEDIRVTSPPANNARGDIDLDDIRVDTSPSLPAAWDMDLNDIRLTDSSMDGIQPALGNNDWEMDLEEVSLAAHVS